MTPTTYTSEEQAIIERYLQLDRERGQGYRAMADEGLTPEGQSWLDDVETQIDNLYPQLPQKLRFAPVVATCRPVDEAKDPDGVQEGWTFMVTGAPERVPVPGALGDEDDEG